MRVFLLIFGLIWAFAAPAAVDLYSARVVVPDQGEAARTAGLIEALGVVLVRITGDRAVLQIPDAKTLLARAPELAQGTGYELSGEVLRLRATFDPAAVASAIQQAGLPFWSANRPTYLLWIGIDSDPPALIGREDREDLQPLLDIAEARGLPVIAPVVDEADLAAVAPEAIAGATPEPLLRAARRYGSDTVIAAWLSAQGRRWNVRWALVSAKGVQQQWQSSDGSIADALAQGLDTLADSEARQYATRSGNDLPALDTLVEVDGVQTLADYARALNYLKQLDFAREVQVLRVAGLRVLFQLRADGGEPRLTRVLAAGSVLREATAPAQARGALAYTLVR